MSKVNSFEKWSTHDCLNNGVLLVHVRPAFTNPDSTCYINLDSKFDWDEYLDETELFETKLKALEAAKDIVNKSITHHSKKIVNLNRRYFNLQLETEDLIEQAY